MTILDNVEQVIEKSKRVTSNINNLHSLREMANACKGCELHIKRTNVVFSRGSTTYGIMVVGMAPAKIEDKEGVPFVGKSGKFLDKMLKETGLSQVYITNVVKCYLAPGKLIKIKCEEACSYFLEKQIDLIKPKTIITLGKQATMSVYKLLGEKDLTNLKLKDVQGTCREYKGIKVYATYHPQYLARFGGAKSKYYSSAIELLNKV